MKTASLFALIAALLIVISAILFFIKGTKKIENQGNYKFIFKIINTLLIMIGCTYFLSPFSTSYYLGEEQKRNIELHLPQIDSSMQLVISDRYLIEYISLSKDSIRHERKTIYRDLIGYDRIEDYFINERLNHRIKVQYIFPNIFRHSKRTNSISKWKSDDKDITTQELDSILNSWGLQEKTYNTIWK